MEEEQGEVALQNLILPKWKDCLVLLPPFLKESCEGAPTHPHTSLQPGLDQTQEKRNPDSLSGLASSGSASSLRDHVGKFLYREVCSWTSLDIQMPRTP